MGQLKSGDTYLNGSLDYLLVSGGKMLRPAFLLIGSRFGKKSLMQSEDLIQLATAIETLHIATLVHDDIVDDAKFRRDRESIQHKYSKEYAVYMGDYLLSQCFVMLSGINVPRELTVEIARGVSKICIGEIRQHTKRYDPSITPGDYLRIASGKTALLFAIALSGGAYMAKADEKTRKLLGKIGYQIGMAFQMIDDIFDYTGDEKKVGKDLKSDLIRGNYALPVIFALEGESCLRESILDGLQGPRDEGRLKDLIEAVKNSGGIEKTRNLALKYHRRAEALIEKLPDNEGREMLKAVLPRLLERLH